MPPESQTITGPMEGAVNSHVLDHLVNGPAAHRDLMDAAQRQDAIQRDLIAALEAIIRVADGESLPGPVYLSIEEVYAGKAALERAKAAR